MATRKTSQLTELTTAPASDDLMLVVDVSDTTQGAAGTTKKIRIANLPAGGGGSVSSVNGETGDVVVATMYEVVKNVAGTTLPKGTPVHVTGNSGNEAEVVAANGTTHFPAQFVLNEDLAPGATGQAIALGFMNNVDVPNAAIYTPGDEVWLAEAGGWTTTRPTGATAVQRLGVLLKVNTSGNKVSGLMYGLGLPAELPNIAQGKVFIGDATGVGVAAILDTDLVPEAGNLYFTDARVEANAAVAANTAKVGITQAQADAIVANTAKVGITQAQADAIVANTAKVGITQVQADAIVANTAKNSYPTADADKLAGIDDGAQVNPTAAGVKTLYESNADTNAFTDAAQAKLAGIDEGAEVNVNADWQATGGDAEILNKPTIPANITDLGDTPAGYGTAGQVLTSTGTSTLWVTPSGGGTGGAVDSVNGLTGTVVLDTDDISEGSTNLYHTAQRVQAVIDADPALTRSVNGEFPDGSGDVALTTTELPEGSNLYYTEARVSANTHVAANTSKLLTIAEGAEVNVNPDWNATTGDAEILNKPNIPTDISELGGSTDDLFEGQTNKYYTDARVNTLLASRNISASYPTIPIPGNTALTSTHEQKMLICDSPSGFIIQIPTGLERDAEVLIYQAGAGAITIQAGAGVTLRNTSGFLNITAGQYAIIGLKKLGTSEVWVITGERKTA